jgi:hypothetical protein
VVLRAKCAAVYVKANEGRYNGINILQIGFNGSTVQFKDLVVATTNKNLKKYDGVQQTGLE